MLQSYFFYGIKQIYIYIHCNATFHAFQKGLKYFLRISLFAHAPVLCALECRDKAGQRKNESVKKWAL